MEVRFANINTYQQSKVSTNKYNPRLSPLRCDTVSFGALKKSQFEGLDFAAVEKFKAPIEQFQTNNDLQKWCKAKVKNDILDKDFGGRQDATKIQRKAMLKEWTDYVLKDNDAYNDATALVILSAVTRGLRPDNDKLPPVLNKGILADCMSEIDSNLKKDKKYAFDLNKMYQNKLQNFYLEDFDTGEKGSKWVVIPSKKHAPENFAQNVDKLKILSNKTWCTESTSADPCLLKGDFHMYIEDGKPKIGIRFVGDEIQEIQGELNNNIVPYDYFDVTKDYIKGNNLKLSSDAENEIKDSEAEKEKIEKIKTDLKEAIEKNDTLKIFDYLGYNPKVENDGSITLSSYNAADLPCKYLGIDENKLLKKVTRIAGDADFECSNITTLENLKAIEGDANFMKNNSLTSLGNLESIGGNAYFNNSNIESLGNLKSIGGSIYIFKKSKLTSLENLEYIGEDAYFTGSSITSLGNLKTIGRDADFNNSQITSLGYLESIGGNAYFDNSQITSIGNLKYIGGNAYFGNSQITDLSHLEVGGVIYRKNL